MRAGKARTLQNTLYTVAARQPARRCICAFSTSCKSSQHDQPSTSRYDQLWDGLSSSMDGLKVSAPRKNARAAVTPRQYTPPFPTLQNQEGDETPSSISRFRSAFQSHLPPLPTSKDGVHENGGKGPSQKLWSRAASESMRENTPAFRQKASSQDYQSTAASSSSSGGVAWADLLAKIQQTRQSNYPSLPADYQHRVSDTRTPSSAPSSRISENNHTRAPIERASHIDESLHDRIFESQAESRKYSLALQEEIRDLQNPSEALNWLQERLFDKTNEESLMSKIDNTFGSSSELYNLYSDLLVDITNYLRTSATPQTSFLPLILAKSHSPTSYLYGCTAKLYAVNIRTKWELYGDIQGVLELIQDMEKGAVHLNPAIKDYIKNISMAVMADRMRAQRELDAEEEAARLIQQQDHSTENELVNPEESQDTIEETQSHNQTTAKVGRPLKFSSDAKIESRLFFTPSQHRALREIERLVVQDQERYFEWRAKEDNLHDNIISRYGRNENRYNTYGNLQANVEGSGDMENVSDVNALIGQYGKVIPVYNPRDHTHPTQLPVARENTPRSSSSRPVTSSQERKSSQFTTAGSIDNNSSFDILNDAVSEASRETQPKLRNAKVKWVKKNKKKSSTRDAAGAPSPLKQDVKKEIKPRISP